MQRNQIVDPYLSVYENKSLGLQIFNRVGRVHSMLTNEINTLTTLQQHINNKTATQQEYNNIKTRLKQHKANAITLQHHNNRITIQQ